MDIHSKEGLLPRVSGGAALTWPMLAAGGRSTCMGGCQHCPSGHNSPQAEGQQGAWGGTGGQRL